MNRKPRGFSYWVYRKITALYPPDFKERFGKEMDQVLQTDQQLRYGSIWIQLDWLLDLVKSVLQEKLLSWEKRMKDSPKLLNGIAFGLITLWIVIMGGMYARILFHWRIASLTDWLYGGNLNQAVYSLFVCFVLLAPLAALILSVGPNLQVDRKDGAGEMLRIHVHRFGLLNSAVAWVSGGITFLMAAAFIISRMI